MDSSGRIPVLQRRTRILLFKGSDKAGGIFKTAVKSYLIDASI